MRVAVTGTPGTGKTTATGRVETDLDVVHLNDVIKSEEFSTEMDEERGSLVADMDAVAEWLDGREDVLFESHLAHNFDADRVVVLRAHPDTVVERLRERGDSDPKADENAESEALDVILSEAVHHHGAENVYEIDTTERDPDEVAAEIEAVLADDREPSAGTVSYVDWL
ncbi:adenylate kinase family protein [Haloarcula nitratireducens]|uniref:Putative adenylate kinase n=1 Tax=Haloarcula nitratireducens TaxID=2487749 RepID=A0AAW4P8A5_9EURY|nr:adenylate kinase family protein [Halomicroarcula nitratireducens]MBX0294276.1 adenylate kinase family protein [Halomicroarcula nitratireducens]